MQTFIVLDDILPYNNGPLTCSQWGNSPSSNGSISPPIIDDGHNPQEVIWTWFTYNSVAEYPKNVFIDHEMKVFHIEEVDLDRDEVNSYINQMLDTMPSTGCMDSAACNYNSEATSDDGSCVFVDGVCDTCEAGSIVDNDSDDDGVCNDSDVCEGFDDNIDSDGDGIADGCDDCPNHWDPGQHDEDQDGLADACNDDDDDGDGLTDCWSYWYDDGEDMTDAEIAAAIDAGECGDFALGNDMQPLSINLLSSYPNPFNPSTTISFNIENSSIIDIDIYDIEGHKIQDLNHDFYISGSHRLDWIPQPHISSGIYFISLKTNTSLLNHKILYLK